MIRIPVESLLLIDRQGGHQENEEADFRNLLDKGSQRLLAA